jgi:hypothetical protein
MLLDIHTLYPTTVLAEVAIGELVDKITILRIKKKHITDTTKLQNITTELQILEQTFNQNIVLTPQLEICIQELQQVNEKLWTIEDAIRNEELHQRFGEKFIQLSRAVYFTNDKRCEIKRRINLLAGSRLIEEKSYSDYRTPSAQ